MGISVRMYHRNLLAVILIKSKSVYLFPGRTFADESTFSKSRMLSASVAGAVADYVFLFSEKYLYTRNTTFLETLQRFKESNQKTQLIRIFENSDS